MSGQFTYKGNQIEVRAAIENPQSEKDLKVSGALIQSLSFDSRIETQVDENGETWFKAIDITSNLGYKNSPQALGDNVKLHDISTRYGLSKDGKNRKQQFINESGLYSLILSSKLPKAQEFKHWVTSEVLPSIRKTGSYSANQPRLVLRTIGDLLAKQHKSIQTTNKTVRQQIGKITEGFEMERSAINISRITNALAFGKHYSCGMRQILTEDESGYLHAVMKAFESAQKKNPNLSLIEIKEKVKELFDPMFISKEEIDRRLQVKGKLKESENKKQLK